MHTISSVSESGDPENQIVRFPVNISIRLSVNFYYYFFLQFYFFLTAMPILTTFGTNYFYMKLTL